MALNIGGPHRGHAAGNTDVEKQASQLASDVKLKVKNKMGSHTDMNPAQVAQAYERQLASSPAPGPVKAIARKKLKIGVTEQYGISELAKQSTVNALLKVFVEGVTVEEVGDIVESDEKKYWIVVTDKKTGNTYRRQATRAKIAELRSNPNIRRVEMTGYHPKETDDKQGQKTSKVKSGKGLDPVGREDADVNNNGVKNDKSDKYLLKRRAAVGNAISTRKESLDPVGQEDADVNNNGIPNDKSDKYLKKRRKAIGNAISSKGTQKEEFVSEAKKAKKKPDQITGEGVNNSKYINTKPTMEQTETNAELKKSSDIEDQQKIKLRQKQVQAALNRQRQTMQLQRSGRLPLNYSEDNNQEGELVDEKLATQYGNPGKLSQSSRRKSLGKGSSIKHGSKPSGYESPREIRDTESKYQKNSFEPEGKIVSEEESDKIRDRQLERGGMGARASQSPAKTGSSKPYDPKKSAEMNKKAVDLVRQSIIARHGKGALM